MDHFLLISDVLYYCNAEMRYCEISKEISLYCGPDVFCQFEARVPNLTSVRFTFWGGGGGGVRVKFLDSSLK